MFDCGQGPVQELSGAGSGGAEGELEPQATAMARKRPQNGAERARTARRMPRFFEVKHQKRRPARLPAMTSAKPPLADEKYINLETFRKDGTGVKTPVWAAPMDGALYVFSAGDSFKVKRIRNNGKARAAACDARGNVRGAWFDGTARIVEDGATIDRVLEALRKKYGVVFSVFDFFASVAGRKKKRAYLEIKLA